jgi:hypothetical protein
MAAGCADFYERAEDDYWVSFRNAIELPLRRSVRQYFSIRLFPEKTFQVFETWKVSEPDSLVLHNRASAISPFITTEQKPSGGCFTSPFLASARYASFSMTALIELSLMAAQCPPAARY